MLVSFQARVRFRFRVPIDELVASSFVEFIDQPVQILRRLVLLADQIAPDLEAAQRKGFSLGGRHAGAIKLGYRHAHPFNGVVLLARQPQQIFRGNLQELALFVCHASDNGEQARWVPQGAIAVQPNADGVAVTIGKCSRLERVRQRDLCL
jgi:hypothetical protein